MKLLKVVANNFKNCEKDFTISFVPIGNKTEEDKEFELHEIAEGLYTYKTLGIIGKNASGKTTTLELLAIVYDIFSNSRVLNSVDILKYIKEPVSLDITFYHEGYLYRYLTEIAKNKNSIDITNMIFKNQKLFIREYKKSYAKNLYDYDKFEELKIVSIFDDENNFWDSFSIVAFKVRNETTKGIFLPSNDSWHYINEEVFEIYNSIPNNQKIMAAILKILDENIKEIKITKEKRFKITYIDNSIKEVSTEELNSILSSGTTKGFCLFALIVYALQNGSDILIDEIENHFHKTLVENLINLFKDKTVNKKHATLIFTTHYCELLDLFNRSDNIYISKNTKQINLENMYEKYKLRPELSKSNKFYQNEFGTNINYESLIDLKKELMK